MYSIYFFPSIQISLISVESLQKFVPSHQLTQEFDGTLPYDNDHWIEARLVSEENKHKLTENASYRRITNLYKRFEACLKWKRFLYDPLVTCDSETPPLPGFAFCSCVQVSLRAKTLQHDQRIAARKSDSCSASRQYLLQLSILLKPAWPLFRSVHAETL